MTRWVVLVCWRGGDAEVEVRAANRSQAATKAIHTVGRGDAEVRSMARLLNGVLVAS